MGEKRKLKVLTIENDSLSVSIYKHYGEKMKNFFLDIYNTVTLEDSLFFLDNRPDIDIIFLDYRMHSRLTGLEILQHIRAKGFKIPIIVVTGSGNEEVAVTMMKAGASDYLVKKNLCPEILEKSITDVLKGYEEMKNNFDKEKDSILKDMAVKVSLNALAIMSTEGIIVYINPSFLTIWGYDDMSNLTGKSIREFLTFPEKFNDVIESLKNKKSWLGELKGKRKNGNEFFLQALFSRIEIEGQETTEIMASFLDITRMKDAENKREALYKGIMEVFALRAEEVGNVETAIHIHRVAEYTRFIAMKLGETEHFRSYINKKYVNDVSYASMLHDVGKWRTPNEILLKAGKLLPSEWEIMKKHPELGVEMLTPLLKDKGNNQYLKLVESVVLYHHERWDGSGYPQGLKGEEIPLSARIVALADMYDALTSARSYRTVLTHEEAVGVMILEKEGFDPYIWKVFIDNQLEFKKIKLSI